jgi:hypothetical protein
VGELATPHHKNQHVMKSYTGTQQQKMAERFRSWNVKSLQVRFTDNCSKIITEV